MISSVAIKRAPKAKRSRMDTVMVEMRTIAGWKLPPFQRQLRINEKVREIAQSIKDDGGVIPGILTIGILTGGRDAGEYLVDGQHRVEAFRLSECREAIADVRYVSFDFMADMGDEFVQLNSAIVRMRPDDVLRGLEGCTPLLTLIRETCPFVGYDQIRRTPSSSVVSMSLLLRIWEGSAAATPVSIGKSSVHLASELSADSAQQLCIFLSLAHDAWKLDEGSKRLWGSLNLGLCMWMYRRLVLDTERSSQSRVISIKNDAFRKCLMSLAAEASYNDWLLGRQMGDRDRAPAYTRIKQIFTRRLLEEKLGSKTTGKVLLPQPSWAKGT